MIPILFEGNVQSFTNNGLGRLADAITCKVTEERNGQFELELTYPITGIHYADIQENRIIFAKTEDGGNNQAFIIYKISRPLNGIITVNAQHISYLLNGFVVMPFTAVSCADAISKIAANTVISTPFAYHTDVESTVSFNLDAPRSVRGLLGGEQGSLLDTYGGYDYKFDNFDVYLYTNRGQDNGVSIRYGKNLTGLKSDLDTTNVYTGIVPFWQDNEGGNTVYLPEKVVLSDHAGDYPYKIIKTVDFSSEFETEPTISQLRTRAQSYISSSSAWKLRNSIDVSFIDLAQTDEYKNIAPLERVKLCDLVTVIYSKLGVNVKTKVIKTVYNVLKERYDSISLGDTTYTLAKAIQGAIDAPTAEEVSSSLKSAINRATKLIQGGLGGHVVFNTNADGEPEEILIMDTDDITTAVNVIRMNLNGIGFSHNGYEGPFETAWTIDGHFVANFIDTGTLNGNLIQANTISADALTVEAQNTLTSLHYFIQSDVIDSISNWEWRPVAEGLISIVQIDDENCLALDGTGLNAYDYAYYGQTMAELLGKQTLTLKFKFRFSEDVNIAQQRHWFIYYYDPTTKSYQINFNNISGEYAKDTWYDIDFTWEMLGTADPVTYVPRFGIYMIPNTITYVKALTMTATTDSYSTASLTYTVDGLSSTVQKDGVISSINQSAEAVTIQASKIDLTGNLNLHGTFETDISGGSFDGFKAIFDAASLNFYDENDNILSRILPVSNGQYRGTGIWFYDNNGNTKNTISFDSASFHDNTYVTGYFQVSDGGDSSQEARFSIKTDFNGDAHFHYSVYNDAGSVVFISDKRKKKSIKDLAIDKAKSFLMALTPRAFKFKEGTSGRYHHGFIAQEVKEAMGGDDWGLYVENKDMDFIGLRYDEIIADLVKVVQDQEKRIQELERKMEK